MPDKVIMIIITIVMIKLRKNLNNYIPAVQKDGITGIIPDGSLKNNRDKRIKNKTFHFKTSKKYINELF